MVKRSELDCWIIRDCVERNSERVRDQCGHSNLNGAPSWMQPPEWLQLHYGQQNHPSGPRQPTESCKIIHCCCCEVLSLDATCYTPSLTWMLSERGMVGRRGERKSWLAWQLHCHSILNYGLFFSCITKPLPSSFLTLVLRPVLVAQNYLGNFMKIPISESLLWQFRFRRLDTGPRNLFLQKSPDDSDEHSYLGNLPLDCELLER